MMKQKHLCGVSDIIRSKDKVKALIEIEEGHMKSIYGNKRK